MANAYAEESSVYIPKFLKKIFLDFEKRGEVVDFYIETFFGSQSFVNSGQIENILNEFPECVSSDQMLRDECFNAASNKTAHHILHGVSVKTY